MKLIALSDGHGMETAGKRTPFIPEIGRYIRENEFNRAVVGYLDIELRRCGFNTLLLAPTDFDTSLDDRTNAANEAKADAYVSIHYNALDGTFDDVDPEGHSIHIYPGSKEGRKLANNIMGYLVLGTEQQNRGIIESNFHELRESNMPAILSENGFMDNRKEALYMIEEDFQREVASEHARGICDYFAVDYIPEDIGQNNFVTYSQLQDILKGYVKKEKISEVSDNPTTIRKYNTFIHIFEAKPQMKVDMDLGVRGEREKVSKIVQDKLNEGLDILMGINCGMFSYVEGSEHNTLYIDEGLYFNPPSGETMDFIFYKDGTTKIENIKGYDQVRLNEIQANAHWGIGTSYSLVQNGEINLENAEKFSHANSKEPRTMFGQKADGSFVLVVTDGRTELSAGLTAHEQAELMKSIGCINAANVDGGGSSTMVVVVEGAPKVVNALSGGIERAVGSVMLVYKKGWV